MTLEEHVHEAWNNALINGYDQWLLDTDSVDIAIDMMDCDGDIQLYSNGMIEDIVGFIDTLQLKYRKEVYGDFPEDYFKLPLYNKNRKQRKKDKKMMNINEGDEDA